MAYQGYLIAVGTTQLVTLPTEYIEGKTYKVTPNQRMEWSAERNVNGELQRSVVANKPPKIEFETIDQLTNAEVGNMMGIIRAAYINEDERKVPISFYDPETDSYKSWNCYLPDIEFPIENIDNTNNVVTYNPIRFAFIGY